MQEGWRRRAFFFSVYIASVFESSTYPVLRRSDLIFSEKLSCSFVLSSSSAETTGAALKSCVHRIQWRGMWHSAFCLMFQVYDIPPAQLYPSQHSAARNQGVYDVPPSQMDTRTQGVYDIPPASQGVREHVSQALWDFKSNQMREEVA